MRIVSPDSCQYTALLKCGSTIGCDCHRLGRQCFCSDSTAFC